jgi:GNAT superfamily N-acetyltransferase
MSVEIRKHAPGKNISDFIRAAHVVFEGDPAWVPPLDFMMREQLSPKKNPFFEHAEGMLFTAWKDGRLVGRISAQIDQEHLKRYNDSTGFFGFFDTIEDVGVAQALMSAAEDWTREHGLRRLRGPLSLSINEEVGLLVEGFDTPPMLLMPHSRPYQGALAEACGLQKATDVLAWRYTVGDVPPRALAARQQIAELPEVTIRTIDRKNIEEEIAAVLEIQDDAWRDNWGHVSLTPREAKTAVDTLKLVLDYRLGIIAEIDGKPAAMCISLPNLNEAIKDLNGNLLPFGWAKLLYRLKIQHTKTARLCLLGIKKEYRGVKRYGALSLALIAEMAKRGREAGYEWGELSWTLEDNVAVNLQIKVFRGEKYKRYRIYEKAL